MVLCMQKGGLETLKLLVDDKSMITLMMGKLVTKDETDR